MQLRDVGTASNDALVAERLRYLAAGQARPDTLSGNSNEPPKSR